MERRGRTHGDAHIAAQRNLFNRLLGCALEMAIWARGRQGVLDIRAGAP
ncbi:MAG: hypothetical protein WAN20_08130 [Pseudonocardiaceae bacterium]